MAAIDYSVGFTKEEVQEILAVHKLELKKTLAGWSDGGASVTKRRLDEIHSIIAACQSALQKLDPVAYPKGRRVMQSGVSGVLPK